MKPLVVGISGPSCSGKTLLADEISKNLTGRESAVISMDSYYRDLGGIPLEKRAGVNFDDPQAIEFDLLLRHVGDLIEGKEILVPYYDYETHTRKPAGSSRRVRFSSQKPERPVVVIEGLHVYSDGRLRDLIDIFVFIKLDDETCLARRIERDTRERGRTSIDVIRRFNQMVAPMFRQHVLPMMESADLVVNGDDPVEESAIRIMSLLDGAMGGR